MYFEQAGFTVEEAVDGDAPLERPEIPHTPDRQRSNLADIPRTHGAIAHHRALRRHRWRRYGGAIRHSTGDARHLANGCRRLRWTSALVHATLATGLARHAVE
jgi:hypothetical protein